jgi:hypothetical protein
MATKSPFRIAVTAIVTSAIATLSLISRPMPADAAGPVIAPRPVVAEECNVAYHLYSGPFINTTAGQCLMADVRIGTYRNFTPVPTDGSATPVTTTFEQQLKARGCSYATSRDVRYFDTTGSGSAMVGWSITVCNDDCATRALIDQYNKIKPVWSTEAKARPGACMPSALPAGKMYVIWDPHCAGQCPAPNI